jgi:hypothetical protein
MNADERECGPFKGDSRSRYFKDARAGVIELTSVIQKACQLRGDIKSQKRHQ